MSLYDRMGEAYGRIRYGQRRNERPMGEYAKCTKPGCGHEKALHDPGTSSCWTCDCPSFHNAVDQCAHCMGKKNELGFDYPTSTTTARPSQTVGQKFYEADGCHCQCHKKNSGTDVEQCVRWMRSRSFSSKVEAISAAVNDGDFDRATAEQAASSGGRNNAGAETECFICQKPLNGKGVSGRVAGHLICKECDQVGMENSISCPACQKEIGGGLSAVKSHLQDYHDMTSSEAERALGA